MRRHVVHLAAVVLAVTVTVTSMAGSSAAQGAERPVERPRPAGLLGEVADLRARERTIDADVDAAAAKVGELHAKLVDARRRAIDAQARSDRSETVAVRAARDANVSAAWAVVADRQARNQQQLLSEVAVARYVQPHPEPVTDGAELDALVERHLRDGWLAHNIDVLDAHQAFARERAEVAVELADRARTARKAADAARRTADDEHARAVDLDARHTDARSELAELENERRWLVDHRRNLRAKLAARGRQLTASIGVSDGADMTRAGSVTVHAQIADAWALLAAEAAADGIVLAGGGWRSSQVQVMLRRAHCGASDFDVYEKPAGQCSPPTAPPGRSLHERGLAVDVTVNGAIISTRTSPAFRWLADNAADFGFYNLPSEPWHWSVTGQ